MNRTIGFCPAKNQQVSEDPAAPVSKFDREESYEEVSETEVTEPNGKIRRRRKIRKARIVRVASKS